MRVSLSRTPQARWGSRTGYDCSAFNGGRAEPFSLRGARRKSETCHSPSVGSRRTSTAARDTRGDMPVLGSKTTYYYWVTSVGADGVSDGVQSSVSQFTTPAPGEQIVAYPQPQ